MIKLLAPVLLAAALVGVPATAAHALAGDSVDLFGGQSHTLPVKNVKPGTGGGCTPLAQPFHAGSAWNHSAVYTAHLYSGVSCDGVVHAVVGPGVDTNFTPEFEVGSILFGTA
ncbi:hypothetical protein [Actinomadura rugatobispora]|uniref:Secreted protein n=1 Tax=Actinomadura rugatobispora TaxID=1994 RepID=A0ABW0ZU84_9ACTN|nr:hypothetical protein GCM10010200_076140 [Actinomadura rugatobispora]